MILACSKCKDWDRNPAALYQDKKYGAGNRVHNSTKKQVGGVTVYRCTVCENERGGK
jgi:hypothetical protein